MIFVRGLRYPLRYCLKNLLNYCFFAVAKKTFQRPLANSLQHNSLKKASESSTLQNYLTKTNKR